MNTYRGVTWHKHRKKYRVKVKCDGRALYLGHYPDAVVAAKVYDCAAKLLHGGNAILNFDGEPPHSIPKAVIIKQLTDYGVSNERLFL